MNNLAEFEVTVKLPADSGTSIFDRMIPQR